MTGIRERLRVLGAVWRDRDLRGAQLAWGGFHAAEWASLVALSVVAYGAHGTSALGLVLFLRMAACAAVTPYVAVLADRHRRESILLAVHLVRGMAFAGAAVVQLGGGSTYVVYAFAIAAAVPLSAHRPCHLGLAPLLAKTPAQLTAANVGTMSLESAAALAGPALAAFLLAVSGAGAVFAACAVVSALSTVAIARVRPAVVPTAEVARAGMAQELRDGLASILANPHVRVVVGLFATQTLVRGFLSVFFVVIALELAGLGEPGVGLLSAAFGFGGLAGALGAVMLVGRSGLGRPFQLALAFWGLPLVCVGLVPSAGVAVVALAVVGLANTVLDIAGFTSIQERVAEDAIGRVFGLFELVVILTVGIGSLVAPVAVDVLGGRAALVAAGALLPAVALLAHRRLARLDDGIDARTADIELLRSNAIFAPLPYLVLRRLATSLEKATVQRGTTIVREGDRGDAMYMLLDGRADVTQASRVVNELGPGDVFGEIALLLDVPRTATVTAAEPVRVGVLPREPFLAAISGHQMSGAALRALVDSRLEQAAAGADADPARARAAS